MKLVECVPNFSEGRNRATIDAIAEAIRSTEGTELLDVDPGVDTNRTVMTFIGTPDAVCEAAFRAIARAAELIDMRVHRGAHSRMGATDVCPFVPVREVSMDECAALARKLGARVADELGIPVYLYEQAASRPERRNLAVVRKGEYEGLAAKLADPDWAPDFGKAELNARSGATIIGAREFLIAYNFNLNTRDRRIAQDIAFEIREAGRAVRDERGEIVRDESGKAVTRPGLFAFVKAVGWVMDDFDCAQVSMNLTNFKAAPLAEVFDAVCRLARERGVRCTGSELVGLIPVDCLLEAGRHYLRQAGKSAGAPERELLRLAVQSLGLGELYPFEIDKKVIERRIPDPRPLVEMSVADFADETSTDSPAPGGGSVAALCGAMAASLASMVAWLTAGKPGYEKAWEPMKALAVEAQGLKAACLRAVDDDTAAFNALMAAMRKPKKTAAQKAERQAAIQQATRGAIEIPLSVLRAAAEIAPLAEQAAGAGLRSSLSDAAVSADCARTAAEGAFYNVLINLPAVDDASYRTDTLAEAERLRAAVGAHAAAACKRVEEALRADLET
ncbi:MAG: glutamate formimidoyltransferase [Deltaproteobacteria bacterium]|nr:glutamate formimidoyltransferase [Deltaproteobacteria bacterium]